MKEFQLLLVIIFKMESGEGMKLIISQSIPIVGAGQLGEGLGNIMMVALNFGPIGKIH